MHPLTKLVCGGIPQSGAIGEVFAHLTNNLDLLFARTTFLKTSADIVDFALYGPLLGRATLEVSFTALVGRFDPMRLLAIRESQLSSAFDPKEKNPMAFNWAGDVRGDEKPKAWDQRPAVKDIQRALLCRHFYDLFWEEAFMRLLDTVQEPRGLLWMADLKRMSPEAFNSSMRGEADRLYSELSKGIHHEFVIPAVAQFDRATVSDLLSRTWQIVANLAVVAHFSPVAHPSAIGDVIDFYEQAQTECYA